MLSGQRYVHKAVNDIIDFNPTIGHRWADSALTFLLAGYHPKATTEFDFQLLQQMLHHHPDDKLVLVDKNHAAEPLKKSTVSLQADLASDIPPIAGIIDLALMHYTLDFIPTQELHKVARTANGYLSPLGILLSFNHYSPFPPVSSRLRTITHRVPYYTRHSSTIAKEMSSHLKLIYWGGLRDAEINVFAKADSPLYEYPTVLGPVCLDLDD